MHHFQAARPPGLCVGGLSALARSSEDEEAELRSLLSSTDLRLCAAASGNRRRAASATPLGSGGGGGGQRSSQRSGSSSGTSSTATADFRVGRMVFDHAARRWVSAGRSEAAEEDSELAAFDMIVGDGSSGGSREARACATAAAATARSSSHASEGSGGHRHRRRTVGDAPLLAGGRGARVRSASPPLGDASGRCARHTDAGAPAQARTPPSCGSAGILSFSDDARSPLPSESLPEVPASRRSDGDGAQGRTGGRVGAREGDGRSPPEWRRRAEWQPPSAHSEWRPPTHDSGRPSGGCLAPLTDQRPPLPHCVRDSAALARVRPAAVREAGALTMHAPSDTREGVHRVEVALTVGGEVRHASARADDAGATSVATATAARAAVTPDDTGSADDWLDDDDDDSAVRSSAPQPAPHPRVPPLPLPLLQPGAPLHGQSPLMAGAPVRLPLAQSSRMQTITLADLQQGMLAAGLQPQRGLAAATSSGGGLPAAAVAQLEPPQRAATDGAIAAAAAAAGCDTHRDATGLDAPSSTTSPAEEAVALQPELVAPRSPASPHSLGGVSHGSHNDASPSPSPSPSPSLSPGSTAGSSDWDASGVLGVGSGDGARTAADGGAQAPTDEPLRALLGSTPVATPASGAAPLVTCNESPPLTTTPPLPAAFVLSPRTVARMCADAAALDAACASPRWERVRAGLRAAAPLTSPLSPPSCRAPLAPAAGSSLHPHFSPAAGGAARGCAALPPLPCTPTPRPLWQQSQPQPQPSPAVSGHSPAFESAGREHAQLVPLSEYAGQGIPATSAASGRSRSLPAPLPAPPAQPHRSPRSDSDEGTSGRVPNDRLLLTRCHWRPSPLLVAAAAAGGDARGLAAAAPSPVPAGGVHAEVASLASPPARAAHGAARGAGLLCGRVVSCHSPGGAHGRAGARLHHQQQSAAAGALACPRHSSERDGAHGAAAAPSSSPRHWQVLAVPQLQLAGATAAPSAAPSPPQALAGANPLERGGAGTPRHPAAAVAAVAASLEPRPLAAAEAAAAAALAALELSCRSDPGLSGRRQWWAVTVPALGAGAARGSPGGAPRRPQQRAAASTARAASRRHFSFLRTGGGGSGHVAEQEARPARARGGMRVFVDSLLL